MTNLEKVKEALKIQGSNGNWNCNPYMMGMYNGLEFAIAVFEDREPQYKSAPQVWLDDLPMSAPVLAKEEESDVG